MQESKRIEKQDKRNTVDRCPGITPISKQELEILDRLSPDKTTLGAILTIKALFNGIICAPEEYKKGDQLNPSLR